MKSETQKAVEAVIAAFLNERGCSRINAAGWATNACLDEYNRMEEESGCKSKTVLINKGFLDELKASSWISENRTQGKTI